MNKRMGGQSIEPGLHSVSRSFNVSIQAAPDPQRVGETGRVLLPLHVLLCHHFLDGGVCAASIKLHETGPVCSISEQHRQSSHPRLDPCTAGVSLLSVATVRMHTDVPYCQRRQHHTLQQHTAHSWPRPRPESLSLEAPRCFKKGLGGGVNPTVCSNRSV